MPRDELSQVERLLTLASYLHKNKATVKQLALHLDPSLPLEGKAWRAAERCVQRDLNLIAKFETLEKTPGRPPRYFIPSPRAFFSDAHLLILHAAVRLTYHRATGLAQLHREALENLLHALPPHVQHISRRAMRNIGRRQGNEDLNLERAAQAWMGAHRLQFQYRKPGGSGTLRTNIVEIYLIEAHPHNLDLYLIGQEITFHHQVRTFKLSRLINPQVLTNTRYVIPDDFNPQQFLSSAWGIVGAQGQPTETIHLRFRADAAYRILEGGYAHLSEPFINPDGSIDTTLEAPLDGSGLPREVLPFIYGFGPRVEVLGPPHIRAHWQQELRAALEQAEREPPEFKPRQSA